MAMGSGRDTPGRQADEVIIDEWISVSHETGRPSGFYPICNSRNRFVVNDGPIAVALSAASSTSDLIDTPEPASLALFGLGAAALAMARRRRHRL